MLNVQNIQNRKSTSSLSHQMSEVEYPPSDQWLSMRFHGLRINIYTFNLKNIYGVDVKLKSSTNI